MEVIKVIVNEIPACCLVCDLSYLDGARPNEIICVLFGDREIPNAKKRPKWCPLVEEGEECAT